MPAIQRGLIAYVHIQYERRTIIPHPSVLNEILPISWEKNEARYAFLCQFGCPDINITAFKTSNKICGCLRSNWQKQIYELIFNPPNFFCFFLQVMLSNTQKWECSSLHKKIFISLPNKNDYDIDYDYDCKGHPNIYTSVSSATT